MSRAQKMTDAYMAASAGLNHAIGYLDFAVKSETGLSRRQVQTLLETMKAHSETARGQFDAAFAEKEEIW